jgi:hypothetical protein
MVRTWLRFEAKRPETKNLPTLGLQYRQNSRFAGGFTITNQPTLFVDRTGPGQLNSRPRGALLKKDDYAYDSIDLGSRAGGR